MITTKQAALDNFAFSEGGSLELGHEDNSISVESSSDRVSFMSDFDITRDAQGLQIAKELASMLAGAIKKLEADQASCQLPEKVKANIPTVRKNPLL